MQLYREEVARLVRYLCIHISSTFLIRGVPSLFLYFSYSTKEAKSKLNRIGKPLHCIKYTAFLTREQVFGNKFDTYRVQLLPPLTTLCILLPYLSARTRPKSL